MLNIVALSRIVVLPLYSVVTVCVRSYEDRIRRFDVVLLELYKSPLMFQWEIFKEGLQEY
jgi:hypothetical protein